MLQSIIIRSDDPRLIIPITGARKDAWLPHTPFYALLALRALFNLRILFFRHFQRIFPRFFQSRELRFIETPLIIQWI